MQLRSLRGVEVCFHTSLIALAGGFTRFRAAEIDATDLPDSPVPSVLQRKQTMEIRAVEWGKRGRMWKNGLITARNAGKMASQCTAMPSEC